MGEITDLQSQLAQLEDNQEFVADLCRFAEEILTEKQVRKKYRLAESTWETLGSNDGLVEKIEAEKVRRIRDGSCKRERAQLLVVKAPEVLSGILLDDSQNARHRIDSAKVLNDFAANGPAGAPAADRFIITINLNGDVEHYNKSISINADDVAPDGIVAAPQRSLLASIPNKQWDDSDVLAAPEQKKPVETPAKTPKHESVVERMTPEQIALESMMRY